MYYTWLLTFAMLFSADKTLAVPRASCDSVVLQNSSSRTVQASHCEKRNYIVCTHPKCCRLFSKKAGIVTLAPLGALLHPIVIKLSQSSSTSEQVSQGEPSGAIFGGPNVPSMAFHQAGQRNIANYTVPVHHAIGLLQYSMVG